MNVFLRWSVHKDSSDTIFRFFLTLMTLKWFAGAVAAARGGAVGHVVVANGQGRDQAGLEPVAGQPSQSPLVRRRDSPYGFLFVPRRIRRESRMAFYGPPGPAETAEKYPSSSARVGGSQLMFTPRVIPSTYGR